jgi:hypothetical protein
MTRLKLPYGNCDFNDIRTENFFYVDKTMYIEKLERLNAKYLFFIRPRRRKTLAKETLQSIYGYNSEFRWIKIDILFRITLRSFFFDASLV